MMSFAELLDSDRHCRFPLDDDHWCGAEALPRGSWCAEHRARIYLPAERIPFHLRLDDTPPRSALDEVRDTWRRMGNPP